jgi:oxygen-independent coproporphyrinogen-3 oxidase
MRGALEGAAIDESREVSERELPFEFMLNALRLVDGFPVALFTERTGLPIIAIARELEAAEAAGLLDRDYLRIRPTAKGQRFLNDLLELFLPQARPRERAAPISISPRGTTRPS